MRPRVTAMDKEFFFLKNTKIKTMSSPVCRTIDTVVILFVNKDVDFSV